MQMVAVAIAKVKEGHVELGKRELRGGNERGVGVGVEI
jgi:hypothetical protein